LRGWRRNPSGILKKKDVSGEGGNRKKNVRNVSAKVSILMELQRYGPHVGKGRKKPGLPSKEAKKKNTRGQEGGINGRDEKRLG